MHNPLGQSLRSFDISHNTQYLVPCSLSVPPPQPGPRPSQPCLTPAILLPPPLDCSGCRTKSEPLISGGPSVSWELVLDPQLLPFSPRGDSRSSVPLLILLHHHGLHQPVPSGSKKGSAHPTTKIPQCQGTSEGLPSVSHLTSPINDHTGLCSELGAGPSMAGPSLGSSITASPGAGQGLLSPDHISDLPPAASFCQLPTLSSVSPPN